ncbi:MAG: AAA family ATPase [Terriglobia bacterium]
MYKKFFGLKENPFNVTPDPRYLCSTPHTEEALACLTYCVQGRKGFVMLTGDVGTGKTTLLNKLLEWLRQEQVATAFVFNPRLNTLQFLDYMMSDFGVNCETRLKSQVLVQLNQWLLERYRAGGTAVLIVDEAQNLSPEVLEEIRLLTNLETSTEKLLQIVLSGQQELEVRLRQPEFRQLRQRITLRCKTYPLTLEETRNYVATRLRVAGNQGRQIFAPAAVEAIHRYSEGIPRVINVICEDALINAFADQKPMVGREIVEAVAKELELDIYPPSAPPPGQVAERTRVNEYSGAAYGLGAAVEPDEPPVTARPGKVQAAIPQGREAVPEPARLAPVAPSTATVKPSPAASVPATPSVTAKGSASPGGVEPPKVQGPVPAPTLRQAAAPARVSPVAASPSPEVKPARAAAAPVQTGPKSPAEVVLLPVSTAATARAEFDAEIVQTLRSDLATARQPTSRPAVKPPSPSRKARHERMTPMVWALIGLTVAVCAVGTFTFKELSGIRNSSTAPAATPETEQPPAPAAPAEKSIADTEAAKPNEVESGGAKENQEAATPPVAERANPVVEPAQRPEARQGPPETPRTPIAPRFGRLVVSANVEGVSVSIDGRTYRNPSMPFTIASLPVGTHRIVVSKPGHDDATGIVNIQEGTTASFAAKLSSPGGEINIATNPPGLGVSIDGGPFAPSPIQAIVTAGAHTYRIKLPGSRVYEGTFEMTNGAIIKRSVDFAGGEWLPSGETQ